MNTFDSLLKKISNINALTLDKSKVINSICLSEETLSYLIKDNIYAFVNFSIRSRNNFPFKAYRLEHLEPCTGQPKWKKVNTVQELLNFALCKESKKSEIYISKDTLLRLKPLKELTQITVNFNISDSFYNGIVYILNAKELSSFTDFTNSSSQSFTICAS